MNKIERWFFKRFLKRQFSGFDGFHIKRTTEVFRMIRETWHEEFFEDNSATCDSILQELLIPKSVALSAKAVSVPFHERDEWLAAEDTFWTRNEHN